MFTDCHEAHQLYQYGQTIDLGPAALSQDDFTSTNTLGNCEDNTCVAYRTILSKSHVYKRM